MIIISQRLLGSFICLVVIAMAAFAQTSVPEKFATLDDQADMTVFNQKLNELITELQKRPETTRAFVALSGNDYKSLIERLKAVRALQKAQPDLKRRISYTEPGVRYEARWKETEFWLLPDKSSPPCNPINTREGYGRQKNKDSYLQHAISDTDLA